MAPVHSPGSRSMVATCTGPRIAAGWDLGPYLSFPRTAAEAGPSLCSTASLAALTGRIQLTPTSRLTARGIFTEPHTRAAPLDMALSTSLALREQAGRKACCTALRVALTAPIP